MSIKIFPVDPQICSTFTNSYRITSVPLLSQLAIPKLPRNTICCSWACFYNIKSLKCLVYFKIEKSFLLQFLQDLKSWSLCSKTNFEWVDERGIFLLMTTDKICFLKLDAFFIKKFLNLIQWLFSTPGEKRRRVFCVSLCSIVQPVQ